MAWARPLFTRGQVDKAGQILVATPPSSVEQRAHAVQVLSDWRASHAYPLHAIKMTLLQRARKVDRLSIVADLEDGWRRRTMAALFRPGSPAEPDELSGELRRRSRIARRLRLPTRISGQRNAWNADPRPASQAVLVSVEALQALRSAFPNYFADTALFVEKLREAFIGVPIESRPSV